MQTETQKMTAKELAALLKETRAAEKAAKPAKPAKVESEKAIAAKEKQAASAQFNSDLLRESLTELSELDSLNKFRKGVIELANSEITNAIETQLNAQTQAYLKNAKDLSAKDLALKAGYLAKCKTALEKIQFAGVFLLSTGVAVKFSSWANLVSKLDDDYLMLTAKILTAKEKKEKGILTPQAYALHFDSGAIFLHDTGKRFVCTQAYYVRLFAGAPLLKSQLTAAQCTTLETIGKQVSGIEAAAPVESVESVESVEIAPVETSNIVVCGENSELNALVSQAISQKLAAQNIAA